jgi:hypothetical protein
MNCVRQEKNSLVDDNFAVIFEEIFSDFLHIIGEI